MYLWKVWKPFQITDVFVVTKEKNLEEVLQVLKNNEYGQPETIEFVRTVLA